MNCWWSSPPQSSFDSWDVVQCLSPSTHTAGKRSYTPTTLPTSSTSSGYSRTMVRFAPTSLQWPGPYIISWSRTIRISAVCCLERVALGRRSMARDWSVSWSDRSLSKSKNCVLSPFSHGAYLSSQWIWEPITNQNDDLWSCRSFLSSLMVKVRGRISKMNEHRQPGGWKWPKKSRATEVQPMWSHYCWSPRIGGRRMIISERFHDWQTTNTNTCGWAVFLNVDFLFRDGHTDKTNTITSSSAGWIGHSGSRGHSAVLYVCAGSQP